MPGGADLRWLTQAPFAHRGLHQLTAGVPENSLAAVEAAASAGYAIELDARLTADGEVVVVHDDDLSRLTGRALRVGETDAATVCRLPLLGTGEHIPTLGTVLDRVGGRVGVMIEVKNFGREVGPLESAVAAAVTGHPGPVCVASFNPLSVAWFGRHLPHVPRGQVAGTFRDVPLPPWLRLAMRAMLGNVRSRPDFLSFELAGLPSRAVALWRRPGSAHPRPLITWTVRSPQDLARARALADNFVFEEVRPATRT